MLPGEVQAGCAAGREGFSRQQSLDRGAVEAERLTILVTFHVPFSTVAVLRLVLAMLRWGLIRHAAPVTLCDWFRAGRRSYTGEIRGGRAVLPDA